MNENTGMSPGEAAKLKREAKEAVLRATLESHRDLLVASNDRRRSRAAKQAERTVAKKKHRLDKTPAEWKAIRQERKAQKRRKAL